MKFNKLFIFITVFVFVLACQSTKPKPSVNNDPISFIRMDTIQNEDTICLRSFFNSDYGKLVFLNPFKKKLESGEIYLFANNLYLGFKVIHNNHIYNKVISLDCPNCFNYFGVYKGDSIDNIEGFNPLIIENNTIRYLIMEGYYYGCNGSFCNFGSILILKFKNKEIQQIYLFGTDKTIYSLIRMKANILDDENLKLQMDSDSDNDTISLIFGDKIRLEDQSQKLCEYQGIGCIR